MKRKKTTLIDWNIDPIYQLSDLKDKCIIKYFRFHIQGTNDFLYTAQKLGKRKVNFAYQDYRNTIYTYIAQGFGKSSWSKDIAKKLFFDIIICSIRKRELDDDNFDMGCKPIPDALKKLGWLYDDSNKYRICHREQITSLQEMYHGTIVKIKLSQYNPVRYISDQDIIDNYGGRI